jgi:hypothetical protein
LKNPHIKKSLNFSENVFKKNRNLYKSLKFSENIFKMPRILKKASHFQKTSLGEIAALPQPAASLPLLVDYWFKKKHGHTARPILQQNIL